MSIHTINKVKGWVKRFLPFYLFTFLPLNALAQEQPQRTYTAEHPLIYEDVWDLWPYCFLNEKGQPDGFNVELIHIMFKELNIPYTIKLKSRQEAFNDLRDGKSDLTMALSAGYHNEYGQYGKNTITLFTQSVATPKSKPIEIYNFKDLGKYKVIVNDNSLSHHLMTDYGWGDNAMPTKDIEGAIQQVSATEEGQILWNTLSLKWLIHQNQIDNLLITPVNMPHGEYKFMSNDPKLLAVLDSVFTSLSTDEKLVALQNKWFYPERQEKEIPLWVWYVVAIIGVLGLILVTYGIIYRIQAQRITKDNSRRNKRLALIMETSKVRMWTFNVHTRLFTWHNENGQPAYSYTAEEFANRYPPKDFEKLREAVHRMERMDHKTDEEENVTIYLKAIDSEDGDKELRDFMVTLSVLRRDDLGHPVVIIGTKKDITEQQASLRASEEKMLRYWSIFETPMLGIILFDENGILININKKACEMFCCDHDQIIAERVSFNDLLDIENLTIDKADGYQTIQTVDTDKRPIAERKVVSVKRTGKFNNKIHLSVIRGDHQEVMGMFAFCRDITLMTEKRKQLHQKQKKLEKKDEELNDYQSNINYIVKNGNVRLASYSPVSHTLTIYDKIGHEQLSLTQARCMTFVDNRYQRKAMHMLSDMDDCLNKKLEADIKTTIRVNGGLTLHLQVELLPMVNKEGKVMQYFGLCLDISELKKSETLMMHETLKAQEIENTQNKFLRNMLQEIRTPLNAVVEMAAELDPEKPNEERVSEIIQNNAQRLLLLINNILYMSRLEAHMVEINKQPTNFAEIFDSHCMNGWSQYRRDSVRYIVENPYEKLVIDIDAANLGTVIERITSMSARNTQNGTIRARYDYIGRKLMISIDDTGEGMTKEELQHIQKEFAINNHTSKELGLSICKELIDQMGGTLEINSEKRLGTTVWITLPCLATDVKRRRII